MPGSIIQEQDEDPLAHRLQFDTAPIQKQVGDGIDQTAIYKDMTCDGIQSQQKPQQRYVKISASTNSVELKKFMNHGYRLAVDSAKNDLWLEIDFQDPRFEKEILAFVCRLLVKQYHHS